MFCVQVLYLDSIDTGVLKLQHNTFPQVRHFGQTTMTSMILGDTLSDFDDLTVCLFGKSKVGISVVRMFVNWSCYGKSCLKCLGNLLIWTCHFW
jgi:hypothetical protein